MLENKEAFKQGLQMMRGLAVRNSNHVTVQDILSCFPGRELDRKDVELIYKYADEEGILIEDYQPHDTRSVAVGEQKLTGEEKEYFKIYLNDLEAVIPCEEDEAEMLLERSLAGEEELLKRLTEGHLNMVLELSKNYVGRGVLIGDLVQEGNMELILALDDLMNGSRQILAGGLRDYLTHRIGKAMKALVQEQEDNKKAGEKIAREANRLLETAAELEEALGREASLAELSEKIGLPEDKVKELVTTSLNAAEFANRDEEAEMDAADEALGITEDAADDVLGGLFGLGASESDLMDDEDEE